MVFNISKSIDLVSPADGKRYTSTREYERSLHSNNKDVMTDKSFRETREQLLDIERSSRSDSPPEIHNHVHIDFANGRVTKSKRDLNV